MEVVEYLTQSYKTSIYLLGVSMGAMNVQRYLAEHQNPKVKGAVAISSPWCAHKACESAGRHILAKSALVNNKKLLFKANFHNPVFIDGLEERGINFGKKKFYKRGN